MKIKNLLFSTIAFCGLFSFMNLNAQNNSKQTPTYIQGPPQRSCGTGIPSQQWEAQFQKQIADFIAANPQTTNQKSITGNSTQAAYTIPVIIHVIHNAQPIGTFPNLQQGQINSQVQVLNDDYTGVGYNISTYPTNAFTNWATNPIVGAASKDGLGRIKISNTNITFCLALKDSLGNILAEPGIHRVDCNTLPALTGTFTSKDPANAAYNTSGKFMGFIDGYIKPNTIWNVSKYLNVWVTDEQASVGLLGYATFPVLSTLPGIPGATGTNKTDGFWSWAASFGSKVIFPGGTYSAGYDLGRTCTHEIGHWVGLRHIWGDGNCVTDYCNDTPPAAAANFVNCPATYPYNVGTCAGPPSNSPDGEMFQNFMDYSYDCAMFMFSEDQRTRMQTAMANSPYRKFLGTHGLCSAASPIANFSVNPNPACVGQTLSITDLSTGSPTSWSYTMTGGAPSTSTLQNPTVSYASPGIYTITLVASNGSGPSTPFVKTVTITPSPTVIVSASPTIVCAGGSSTLSAIGALTYTWSTSATTSVVVVTPTINTTYTVTGSNGSCSNTKTISVAVSGSPTINIAPASATICAGNTATFTGSGATNYTWMPGNINTATISVSPTITTTYTLTGTNAAGCASTKTTQVTVNTTPTVSVVASPTAICVGSNATITASGAATYSWNTGATTAAIVVTPTTTTNYTVTGTNGTCSNTKTISVAVNPGPASPVAASNSPLCAGSTLNLLASTIPGATYYWNGPNSFTSTIQNPNIPGVTTLAAGVYSVMATVGGCTGPVGTTNVIVNPLPTVTITSNPLTICPGSSATLTASSSGPGPLTYLWSTGSTSASITSSIVGVFTATVTNGNGCKGSQSYSLNAAAGLTLNITATPTSVCSGGSTTLTASGASTYTWNTGPTTAVIVVSPTTATTYTVNGTSGSCSGSQTISINVNANPTVAVTASPTLICSGSTSTLTATGATTYSWSTGATAAVIAVTPTTTTTYTVTGSNAAGCSNTKTVSVSTIAAPSVSVTATPASICSGSSATLTASGATTYSWNTSATTAAIIVSPGTTTTYTVIGSNGTCVNPQTTSVTVNITPTVAATAIPATICAGATSTLNATGAATYSWSTGGTGTSIAVTPTITSTYTVTGTNGTCSDTKTVSVTVNSAPSVSAASSASVICVGQSATLTSSGAASYTYNPGAITGNPIAVSPTVTTTYIVSGSTGAGCTGTTSIIQTVSPCTGITPIATANTNFGVYPNPNNGEFYVSIGQLESNTFIEVYNTIGQLVNKQLIKDSITKINLTESANGIYYVIITKDGKHFHKEKVIKD